MAKKNKKHANGDNGGDGKKRKKRKQQPEAAPRKASKRESSMLDALKLDGKGVAIAGAAAGGLALLQRASARQVKEAGSVEAADKQGGLVSYYRKARVIKKVGAAGSITAAAAGVAYFTGSKLAKAIAVGAGLVTLVGVIRHGGLYDAKEAPQLEGELKVAGLGDGGGGGGAGSGLGGFDALAMAGELLEERVDLVPPG